MSVSPCPVCGAMLLGPTAARVADPRESESCPNSSLPVDSSYPQESPVGGTYSGRDGVPDRIVPQRHAFPPGSPSVSSSPEVLEATVPSDGANVRGRSESPHGSNVRAGVHPDSAPDDK